VQVTELGTLDLFASHIFHSTFILNCSMVIVKNRTEFIIPSAVTLKQRIKCKFFSHLIIFHCTHIW